VYRLGWTWIVFGALSLPVALVAASFVGAGVDEGAWIAGTLTIGAAFAASFVLAGLLVVFEKRWGIGVGWVACMVAFLAALILLLYGSAGRSPIAIAWGVSTVCVVGVSVKKLVEVGRLRPSPSAVSGPPEQIPDLRIFISYRREDSAEMTDRICEYLTARFGRQRVFRDLHSIPLGVDFRRHIEAAVAGCDVLLAVVGAQWLEIQNAGGRRLDDPTDFVRLEIEAALARDVRVIPVILTKGRMPQAEQLPSSMRDFAFRNGLPVRPDPDFRADMGRLMEALAAEKVSTHERT
jgi:TIR domain-containing protein